MKTLILGSGFVAQAYGGGVSRSTIDYTNPHEFRKLLRERNPDVVINCAGFTGRPNIDQCEVERGETLRANLIFPAMLSHECQGRVLVHISSGCIYTGDNEGKGWSEKDKPEPLSFYSQTKALSEEVINGYILRIRMPFLDALHPRDFITKIMSYPKLINHPNSLTYLPDLVLATKVLLEEKAPYGIYNVVNEGAVTHRDIVERFNAYGIQWTPQFIGDAEFSGLVRAPRSNCVLNTKKLNQYLTLLPAEERIANVAYQFHKKAA